MKMNLLDKIATILLIIGGFNWGLVGWLDYNLVDTLFGEGSIIARVIYAIVGAASLYCIYTMVKMMSNPTRKK
jgi:uncharacterized membrane protein YuzA (DUF378 family)